MFIMDELTGDIITRQGDDFEISVTGITDDWTAYFSVYRGSDRARLFEISKQPENSITVFKITPENSDKMVVSDGKKTETYYYGIKRCKEIDGFTHEDTVIVGNKNVGDLNKITVYPKITEGAEDGAS